MKTVKLKIRKGISLLYAGIFVYTFSACSAGRTEQQPNSVSQDEQQLYIGDSIAVAQTQYGKVRGYLLRDIYTFCGIPYGASTAGENRFMPPANPSLGRASVQRSFGAIRLRRLRQASTATHTLHLPTIGITMASARTV